MSWPYTGYFYMKLKSFALFLNTKGLQIIWRLAEHDWKKSNTYLIAFSDAQFRRVVTRDKNVWENILKEGKHASLIYQQMY